MEKRYFQGELRAERASDGKFFVTGRAASYSTRSENLGWGSYAIYEELEPGCFDHADTSDCIHAIDHDPSRLLGKVASGTLTLATDGRGLSYRSELPDTTWARDLAALIKRGDASYSSFAFTMPADGSGETWSEIPDPADASKSAALRTITRIEKLYDVATLTGHPPAYPGTGAGLSDRFATMPAEFRARLSREQGDIDDTPDDDTLQECQCDCPECKSGECDDCSNEDCTDENCRCEQSMRAAHPDDSPVDNEDHARAGRELDLALLD